MSGHYTAGCPANALFASFHFVTSLLHLLLHPPQTLSLDHQCHRGVAHFEGSMFRCFEKFISLGSFKIFSRHLKCCRLGQLRRNSISTPLFSTLSIPPAQYCLPSPRPPIPPLHAQPTIHPPYLLIWQGAEMPPSGLRSGPS